MTVAPPTAKLPPAGGTTFTAAVTGTANTAVTWSVTETGGGTVDSSGNYVAPGVAGTFHVVVRSAANPAVSASAVVTVTAASPPAPPPAPPPLNSACGSEPLRSTGTVYYVCDCQAGAAAGCVPGSDANAGTSPTAPWQSWSKAMAKFKTMAGGDTVALCRGGAWNGVAGSNAADSGNSSGSPQSILNANCSATATCDFRDYSSPAFSSTSLPRLNPAAGIEMFGIGRSRWNSQGYTATPVRGFRILNLDLVANGNGAVDAIRIYGKAEDVEICGLTVRDGWRTALSMVTTSTVQRVNFHHNRVTNNPFGIGAIHDSSCAADCTFDSNYFDLNGGASDRDHSFYIGSAPDPSGQFPGQLCGASGCYIRAQRTRITNNEFYRSARGAGSTCVGTALVGHEPHDDLVIENNLIHEDPGTASGGCFGIQLSSGGDAPASLRRAVIRRNQVFNVGNQGIAVSECQDCTIDSNLVVAPKDGGIVFPTERSTSAAGSEASSASSVLNNTVYRGTILVNSTAGNLGVNEGTGHVAANNVTCGPAGSASGVNLGSGATGYNNRADSACTGFFVNPTTDPMTANFLPSATSPLVGAGSTQYLSSSAIGTVPWSAADTGMARDTAPDIGAFEK